MTRPDSSRLRWVRPAAGAVTVLTAASALTSPWLSPLPDDAVPWVVWETIVGLGLVAAGWTALLVPIAPARFSSWSLMVSGWLLLSAPSVEAVGQHLAALALWTSAVLVALPLALTHAVHSRGRPTQLRVADIAITVSGTVAALGSFAEQGALTAWAISVDGTVVLCVGYLLVELTTGIDRRRVLWLILGTCIGAPGSVALLFILQDAPHSSLMLASILCGVVSLALPAAAAIALTNPQLVDVRTVMRQTVVAVVMLVLVIAVYVGGQNAVLVFAGASMARPAEMALVALIAGGFHPTMRWVRNSIDELLFGGRPDPVSTLAELGTRMAAESKMDDWLEALRVALDLPHVALVQDGVITAATGSGADSALTFAIPLKAHGKHVGELVAAVPAEHLRLTQATQGVLQLVAAPLAQALHASALAEQLRDSRSHLVTVLEEERRRVRRDLHDGLGPTLTGIGYSADAAANLMQTDLDQARSLLQQLRADTGEAITEVRRIVYGLRPKALDELGLIRAIHQRTASLRTGSGQPLAVNISAPDTLPELPAAVEVAAYRIAVEAITNVGRHTAAAQAHLHIAIVGDALDVTVSDNGGTTGPWKPGVGMESMRERAEQIGGHLSIEIQPDGGRVNARLPLESPVPSPRTAQDPSLLLSSVPESRAR